MPAYACMPLALLLCSKLCQHNSEDSTHKLLPVYLANAVPGWYKRVSAGMGSTQKRIKTSYFMIHSKQVNHGVIDYHGAVGVFSECTRTK